MIEFNNCLYKPYEFNGIWYIKVTVDDLGDVLLLNPEHYLPVPVEFNSKGEAWKYLNEYIERQR